MKRCPESAKEVVDMFKKTHWVFPLEAYIHSGVRLALSGAAKLPDFVADEMSRRFGVVIREGYGLTEASPVVTTSVGIEPRRGSVGKAARGVEVRLVDEDGEDCENPYEAAAGVAGRDDYGYLEFELGPYQNVTLP